MSDKFSISPDKQKFIVYVFLTLVTLAVYWQLNRYDFINFDDPVYIIENDYIKSGITPDSLRWAFTTTLSESWHPLTWLSFMLDYQIYGLNPGGFHTTSVILHLLSVLLLFWLFCRMTSAIWPSAFVAALFAIHPLHAGAIAMISERKDVLSAFFWMLTLCFYVYYTEKPNIKRYLFIVFSFACALMSKPAVVTLPLIMILLDYWPLKRFEQMKDNRISWQIKEKSLFFIMSAVICVVAFLAHGKPYPFDLPFGYRLVNSLVAFVTYLGKTLWPQNLAAYYSFELIIPLWLSGGSILLVVFISAAIIAAWKKLPYLFVGWLWYTITIFPVIGIIKVNLYIMTDHYTYLPCIGIAFMLAWGIPLLIPDEGIRKKILIPAAAGVLAVWAVLTWQQCHYWKNSITLFGRTLQITENNHLAHINLANYFAGQGMYNDALTHYKEGLRLRRDYAEGYSNRGNVYGKLGRNDLAVKDYNEAIRLNPRFTSVYNNRGILYTRMGRYQDALKDFNESIRLNPDSTSVYNNRGTLYFQLGQYASAIDDFNKAISLQKNCFEAYYNKGRVYAHLGQYQPAVDNFIISIVRKPDNLEAFKSLAVLYFKRENTRPGCYAAQKACELGDCKILEMAKKKMACP